MPREIYRRYPIPDRKILVERLIDRGLLAHNAPRVLGGAVQPGQCCDTGCVAPDGLKPLRFVSRNTSE
jgi:4-hydroxybutyryl-CoA dehydratase/vinylacetyl-CoA-Delta-isomerase